MSEFNLILTGAQANSWWIDPSITLAAVVIAGLIPLGVAHAMFERKKQSERLDAVSRRADQLVQGLGEIETVFSQASSDLDGANSAADIKKALAPVRITIVQQKYAVTSILLETADIKLTELAVECLVSASSITKIHDRILKHVSQFGQDPNQLDSMLIDLLKHVRDHQISMARIVGRVSMLRIHESLPFTSRFRRLKRFDERVEVIIESLGTCDRLKNDGSA